MKTLLLSFLIGLFTYSISSACSCLNKSYFCEAIQEDSHVVRGEIIDIYEIEQANGFEFIHYIDLVIQENILGDFATDTISIVGSSINTCNIVINSIVEIGQELILTGLDENNIDDVTGYPYMTLHLCSPNILFVNEDETVEGYIRPDLEIQSYEEFKLEIGICSDLTAIDRLLSELDRYIHILPNPTSDYLDIESDLGLEEPATIELYNAMGQLVHKELFNLKSWLRLETKNYASGVYFLKLQVRNQIVVRKIVKN